MTTRSKESAQRRRTRGFVVGMAAVACLAAPSSAGAAVIVGSDNLAQSPGSSAGTCPAAAGGPCSFYTVTQSDGAAENGSPITGVLVSARVQTTGAAVTLAVRVLRLNPMMADTFLNVGPEIPIPVTADATSAGHMTEATGLHHPINMGERLGVGWANPATYFSIWANPPPGMGACGHRIGAGNEHPVDTERTYITVACPAEILVQGTVEPDADRDNFGDETQDMCPTNAAVQTACPIPPGNPASPINPAGHVRKRKCKKKQRGAATAKRKKCRKKRR